MAKGRATHEAGKEPDKTLARKLPVKLLKKVPLFWPTIMVSQEVRYMSRLAFKNPCDIRRTILKAL